MSKATVIACDGCEATARQEGKRPMYPEGWLRLSVTGRPPGATGSQQIATVDVCCCDCAREALMAADASVRPAR